MPARKTVKEVDVEQNMDSEAIIGLIQMVLFLDEHPTYKARDYLASIDQNTTFGKFISQILK